MVLDIMGIMMTDMTGILLTAALHITGEVPHPGTMMIVVGGGLDLMTVTGSITEKFLDLIQL